MPTRRNFFQTALSAPLALAVPRQAELVPAPELTRHQKAVVAVVQQNMRHHNEWIQKDPGFGAVIDDAIIETIFPDQFSRMLTLRLGGIFPMTRPAALIFQMNGLAFTDGMELYGELPLTYYRILENKQDWQSMALDWPSRKEWGFDRPDFTDQRLKKRAVCSRSTPLKSPYDFACHTDRAVIGTVASLASPGDWDVMRHLGTPYVIAHPDDAHEAHVQSGMKPIVTNVIAPGAAYVGFKESEYHASFYYVPYVAILPNPKAGELPFKSRWAYSTYNGQMSNFYDAATKPEFWRVNLRESKYAKTYGDGYGYRWNVRKY